MALSNRGSQKDLRLPSIFAKLFPPTKLQRGTGVDHVTSSQPRGLLFRLCTHLSRCGGASQRRLHDGGCCLEITSWIYATLQVLNLDVCINLVGALGSRKRLTLEPQLGSKTCSLNGLTRHVDGDGVDVVKILPCFAYCILRRYNKYVILEMHGYCIFSALLSSHLISSHVQPNSPSQEIRRR